MGWAELIVLGILSLCIGVVRSILWDELSWELFLLPPAMFSLYYVYRFLKLILYWSY